MPKSVLWWSPAHVVAPGEASVHPMFIVPGPISLLRERGELLQPGWGGAGGRQLPPERQSPAQFLQGLQQVAASSKVGHPLTFVSGTHVYGPGINMMVRLWTKAHKNTDTAARCRDAKSTSLPCPSPGCTGILAISTFQAGKPAGLLACTVCSTEYQSCGSGQKCCNAGGHLQLASTFDGAQAGKKRVPRCKACTDAEAASTSATAPAPEEEQADCQGSLSQACSTNGKCKLPATCCSACTHAYTKELSAVYAFLRASLLVEVADGGQKLDFVKFAGPLHATVNNKAIFPKKDISFVFDMQTPQSIRATVSSLQQKFEVAGGRVCDAIAGGRSKSKPSAPDRMFWDAPVAKLATCTASCVGANPWTKGIKGAYYLQRLCVIKLSDSTAFNYQQHLNSLRRVFSKPEQYFMQAPRESYNDYTGGLQYKFSSIYKIGKHYCSKDPVGAMLHGGELQRCLSLKMCPTDEALHRVLRSQ